MSTTPVFTRDPSPSSNPTTEDLRAQIRTLQEQLRQSESTFAALSTRNLSIVNTPKLLSKINPPEIFDGRRDRTRTFLAQCRTVFESFTNTSEHDQITYAASFLRKTAFEWYENRLAADRGFDTFIEFSKALRSAFGEANEYERAKAALSNLKQTKSCAIYTSEFNRLVAVLNYEDHSLLIEAYRKGLKDSVKDLLLTLRERNTLARTQTDAIKCDERIFRRESERRNAHVNLPMRRRGNSPDSPERPKNQATPMDVDAVDPTPITGRKGKLTSEERERRKRLNLCLYDGKSDCPGKQSLDLCPNVKRKSGNGGRPLTGR